LIHLVHDELPFEEKEPAAHATQDDDSTSAKVPAAQMSHIVAPPPEYVPPVHERQED
jgi:hypothetical protein